MKRSLLWYVSLPFRLLLLVWYRRPAGRGTSDPGLPNIKGLVEFDAIHPRMLLRMSEELFTRRCNLT